MNLSLYITKLGTINKTKENFIDRNDWINLVDSDPDLKWYEDRGYNDKNSKLVPPKTVAMWKNPKDAKKGLVFHYSEGEFSFGFGNDLDCLRKILEVSRKLNATLQTGAGHDIDERYINGEVGIPEDGDGEIVELTPELIEELETKSRRFSKIFERLFGSKLR